MPTATRVEGADRYATAIAVSNARFPGTAPTGVGTVYVATGHDFADALSAAPAATKQNGVTLLVDRKLTAALKAELKRLNPTNIVVVGGSAAVSDSIVADLARIKTTKRIGGADRYETSVKVNEYAFGTSTATSAYIATGTDFADALSAAAVAGAKDAPVVLVKGSGGGSAKLSKDTTSLLEALKVTKTVIVGGKAAVSEGIEKDLKALGTTVRYGGGDRYDTSRLLNAATYPSADPARTVFLATGKDFPDALAGAVLAAANNGPLYTAKKTCITADTLTDIQAAGATKMTLLGGPAAINVQDKSGKFVICK